MAVEQNFSVKALWTDQVEEVGVNVRISFFVLVQLADDSLEWHYFGVTEAERPLPHHESVPVTEHAYVQFPADMTNMPEFYKAANYWYQLAIMAGMNAAGAEYYVDL